jgi:hypothetical protein
MIQEEDILYQETNSIYYLLLKSHMPGVSNDVLVLPVKVSGV